MSAIVLSRTAAANGRPVGDMSASVHACRPRCATRRPTRRAHWRSLDEPRVGAKNKHRSGRAPDSAEISKNRAAATTMMAGSRLLPPLLLLTLELSAGAYVPLAPRPVVAAHHRVARSRLPSPAAARCTLRMAAESVLVTDGTDSFYGSRGVVQSIYDHADCSQARRAQTPCIPAVIACHGRERTLSSADRARLSRRSWRSRLRSPMQRRCSSPARYAPTAALIRSG